MRLGFVVLIGLPGSGKTTLSKTLVKNTGSFNNACHFIHICFDEFIRFTNGNYESEWKSARNSLLAKIEKFVISLKNRNIDSCPTEFISQFKSVSSWESDIFVILDDNMYFKSMRYSLFQIARNHKMGFCQVFLNCTLENALLKNSFRGPNNIIPPHVIEKMHFKLEPPNPKNKWEKYSIELDAFGNLNEMHCKLIPILNESLSNFFYVNDNTDIRDLSLIESKKSILHQSDIALRRIISLKIKNYLKENSSENFEFKEFITNLNSRKTEVLSDLKTGIISLPENVLEEINADVLEKFQLVNFLGLYF